MRRLLAVVLAVAAFCVLVPALGGTASAATVIDSSTIENAYPTQLKFKVTVHADSNITDVTLSYAIAGRGTSALVKPSSLTPAKDLSTEVVLQVNSAASYIPVGSDFLYHWEITTADGATFKSPDTPFLFLPPDQQWQSVKGDFMAVYYHGSNQDLANAYLKAGIETFDKMSTKLLNTQLKQTPVKVILFDNEKESDPARPGGGSGKFDQAVTTCGTKVTNDIILIIPVSCGTPDKTDTLRHEFTHILTDNAGAGPLSQLPAWLDEGTAVNGQLTPGDNFTGAFDAAVRANRLLPFSSMAVEASSASLVNLFYGQSYMMAKYLIAKGPDKYAQLFATMKKGNRVEDALKQVYGFDLAGFETEFRQANGLKAAAQATAASPTQAPSRSQATAVPTARAAAGTNSSSSGDSGLGTTTIVLIGVAALFVLLAAFSFLVTMMLANNRKKAPTAPNLVEPPPAQSPQPLGPSEQWPPEGPPTED
jgi:hypothetical protein